MKNKLIVIAFGLVAATGTAGCQDAMPSDGPVHISESDTGTEETGTTGGGGASGGGDAADDECEPDQEHVTHDGTVFCADTCSRSAECSSDRSCQSGICMPDGVSDGGSSGGSDGETGSGSSGSSGGSSGGDGSGSGGSGGSVGGGGDLPVSVVNIDVSTSRDRGRRVYGRDDCRAELAPGQDCCQYDYTVAVAAFSRETDKVCQVARNLSEFSPGGRTKGFLTKFVVEDHHVACENWDEFRCPVGRTLKFSDGWEDGDSFTPDDAWLSAWDENGREIARSDAKVGSVSFSGNCRMQALVKYYDRSVQESYSFSVDGPWPTDEVVCSKK